MTRKQTLARLCPLLGLLLMPMYAVAQAPNLVPDGPAASPNYWCTWYAQNYWIGRGTDLGSLSGVTNPAAREELDEDAIFNPDDGWATTYLPRGRADFIFLIDHGWQTKNASLRVAGGPAFFNLVAEPSDFPRYAGLEPPELLRRFNEDIKSLGWNSLGIWMRGDITPEQARAFVRWSKEAGITYWKIDGGDIAEFNSFRAKEEIYPELVIEYVTGAGGNLNPRWNEDLDAYPSVYEIGGRLQKPMLECLQHSDTFRTYDASPLLMSVTTLRRTHDILKQTQQQPQYRSVLNIQDDCNIAIGLGVLVASKRHPNTGERTYQGRDLHHQLSGPRRMQHRINEVERLGRWARLAPAFPAGEGVYLASEIELIDRCEFTPWDTWAKQTYGKTVSQSAPAVMARNMPLPIVVCDGPPPFVCATTYPNGPTGIATEGRVAPDNKWFHPRAQVTVAIKDAGEPIGIAGHYKELILRFAGSLSGVEHVWAQDLLADVATDIHGRVRIDGNALVIPGDLIDEIGTAAGDEGDNSAPGMVLRLEGSNLPIDGDGFKPVTVPVIKAKHAAQSMVLQADGYSGTAILRETFAYEVTARGPADVVLKPLDEPITSGTVTVRWRMKPANDASTRNGFLLVSSDDRASTAICGGAWIGSGSMTLFETGSAWTAAPTTPIAKAPEYDCKLTVNLDERSATLSINGRSTRTNFTESLTSIGYLGFGVHEASTFFTEPRIE